MDQPRPAHEPAAGPYYISIPGYFARLAVVDGTTGTAPRMLAAWVLLLFGGSLILKTIGNRKTTPSLPPASYSSYGAGAGAEAGEPQVGSSVEPHQQVARATLPSHASLWGDSTQIEIPYNNLAARYTKKFFFFFQEICLFLFFVVGGLNVL